MGIEQEAEDFIMGKRKQFNEALFDATEDLIVFVMDNVHGSTEREDALKYLQLFELLTKEAAKNYGIK